MRCRDIQTEAQVASMDCTICERPRSSGQGLNGVDNWYSCMRQLTPSAAELRRQLVNLRRVGNNPAHSCLWRTREVKLHTLPQLGVQTRLNKRDVQRDSVGSHGEQAIRSIATSPRTPLTPSSDRVLTAVRFPSSWCLTRHLRATSCLIRAAWAAPAACSSSAEARPGPPERGAAWIKSHDSAPRWRRIRAQ
eukprot:2927742-Pleurochrysis_carterae.AAC.4